MRIAGIDPGRTGAIALVEDGRCVAIHDLPHVLSGTQGGSRRIDIVELRLLLASLDLSEIVIEEPTPRPGNSAKGAWTSGYGFGVICATASALVLPVRRVLPSRWTAALRLPGKSKAPSAARALALELYPHAAPMLTGPKGGAKDGRVDALLIAHWGATKGEGR